jgi:hypothetical protein
MTRAEAITTITNALAAVDDKTLEAAAAHIDSLDPATGVTVGDILKSVQTDSVLPRHLTDRERAQIAQSREDFRTGQTLSGDELDAFLDARRAARRGL